MQQTSLTDDGINDGANDGDSVGEKDGDIVGFAEGYVMALRHEENNTSNTSSFYCAFGFNKLTDGVCYEFTR